MVNSSVAALTGPGVALTTPAGSCGCTCAAMTASTRSSVRTPEATTSAAPEGERSSRGWSRRTSGAGPPTRATARATATRPARWASWPQACMPPPVDVQGTPVASSTASPSSSARSATEGPGPSSPRTTRPVSATGRPSPSPSAATTASAVSCSSPDSRGSACSWWRSSTAAGSSSATAAASRSYQATSAGSGSPAGTGDGTSLAVTPPILPDRCSGGMSAVRLPRDLRSGGHPAAEATRSQTSWVARGRSAQPVGPFGVAGADHRGDPGCVGRRPGVLRDPLGEVPAEAAAEEHGAQQVELGQAEGVGGEQHLAEGGELEELAEQRPGSVPEVVGGQPDVDEDVAEDLGEEAGVAVERVVVQQHDRHAGRLGGPQQVGEQQRVAPVQVDVGVPVPDVELHRQLQVDAGQDKNRVHHGAGDPQRPAGRKQPVGGRGDLGVGGPGAVQC